MLTVRQEQQIPEAGVAEANFEVVHNVQQAQEAPV
jgi:hypothetical protein